MTLHDVIKKTILAALRDEGWLYLGAVMVEGGEQDDIALRAVAELIHEGHAILSDNDTILRLNKASLP